MKHTSESIQKMREFQAARMADPEYRNRIREKWKKAWELRRDPSIPLPEERRKAAAERKAARDRLVEATRIAACERLTATLSIERVYELIGVRVTKSVLVGISHRNGFRFNGILPSKKLPKPMRIAIPRSIREARIRAEKKRLHELSGEPSPPARPRIRKKKAPKLGVVIGTAISRTTNRHEFRLVAITEPMKQDAFAPLADSRSVPIVALRTYDCRWPVHGGVFCGLPQIEGKPYCACHCRLAYQSRAA